MSLVLVQSTSLQTCPVYSLQQSLLAVIRHLQTTNMRLSLRAQTQSWSMLQPLAFGRKKGHGHLHGLELLEVLNSCRRGFPSKAFPKPLSAFLGESHQSGGSFVHENAAFNPWAPQNRGCLLP